jgi:Zn-dependent protease with chaperone function
MSLIVPTTLNLLVNAILPFALALGIVLAMVRLLRLPPGRMRLAFLLLPFSKLIWDLCRGIPGDSFLWAHLAGVVRESGSLKLGLGDAPPFGLRLEAVMTANTGSVQYGLSWGDLATLGCDRLAPWCAASLVALLIGVAIYRLWRPLHGAVRFVFDQATLRRRSTLWRRCPVRGRLVDVLIAPTTAKTGGPTSVPYAAGVLRPYVCFPAPAFDAMTDLEREAVLQHELAHVAHHHLAIRSLVDLVACLFWFVPGVAFLARKVADDCELMADDEAVKKVEQTDLASALVTIGELLHSQVDGTPPRHAVFAGESKPRLVSRVERLIAPLPTGKPKQARWSASLWRLLLFLVTAQSILAMVVGNNA